MGVRDSRAVSTAYTYCKACLQALGLEDEKLKALMRLDAAYCKLDTAKAEYAEAKQKTKEARDENPASEG